MLLEITTKVEGNTFLLILKGVLDVSTVENFKSFIDDINSVMQVDIDFNRIKFIDSTGIGGLAQGIKKLQEKNYIVKVINIPPGIFEVLDVLGLPEIFGEEMFAVQGN